MRQAAILRVWTKGAWSTRLLTGHWAPGASAVECGAPP
jgi:hypothetical protein